MGEDVPGTLQSALKGRRVTIGVGGGIAAYKAAELVRLLVKAEASVRVILTRAGERFITPLTLQALSGREVASELFDLDRESRIGHIALADEAELLVIAPATADLIARLAHGLADELLTTVALATKAPLVLSPSMNVNMWDHPATRANLETLIARGAYVVQPGVGFLACGWSGAGRLAEPPEIVAACKNVLARTMSGGRDLQGVPVVVTAGPTQEAIDPVRYLGNRSSGKMGFAIARAAAARGAAVTLIAGPVALPTPPGVERIDVDSALALRDAVFAREEKARVVVMAAAVADYRPQSYAPVKLKKTEEETLTLVLKKNPDVLAELAERRRARGRGPLLIGFAAETGGLEDKAKEKLARKGCDLLVANDVAEAGSGFGTETNRAVLFAPGAEPERLPLQSKDALAQTILDRVAARLRK